ncbi:hypothetical protein JCGZ_25618 [Jatropha curcas]|uniref:G-patch domain-containing protein n=1 Tax=Jatropha curcas TaxID=180498 RepID=A0A067JKB7_JATCU|nr:uncharacterized protein LOC105646838 [Jatropha curcas]KDP24322.1 hypothetical protein JCGZ_25618 [Jatropha curcas]
MVYIRFISLVLGLLFLLNALKDYSCAHAHLQDWEMDKDKLLVLQKELVDHGFTITKTRKLGLGGKKMAVHEVELRRETQGQKGRGFHGEANSDEQNNALAERSLEGSQDQYLNHQKKMKTWKRKTEKSGRLGSPRSTEAEVNLSNRNPKKQSNQESKKLPTKASLERSENQEKPNKVEETQRLLEATKEIVNLMNKDYKGMDRPRRKPPINNHVPIH